MKRQDSAFTLIEVLVSLVLVGVILPTAMAGISLAMGMNEIARQRAEAAALASAKLNEVVATKSWQDGNAHGDFGTDQSQYAWTQDVADWDTSSLKQVTLSVNWTWRGRDRSVSVSTLVYTGLTQ